MCFAYSSILPLSACRRTHIHPQPYAYSSPCVGSITSSLQATTGGSGLYQMSLLNFFKPLAYISLPVFLLRTASKASPLARYYVRLGIYLSTVGICSVWGVVASIGMSLIGKRYDIKWFVARSFYLLAGKLLDITIEVEGEEYLSQRPSVMLGNHLSMLDLLYLGRYDLYINISQN